MFDAFGRRGRVRIVTFLSAAFLLLCGTAISEHYQSVQLQRAVTNSYLHAFSEVTASLDRMDAALQKGVYVTSSPMLCSLCGEVFAQATAAQMALGQLPFADVELEQTAAFVSTVGDYAQALSRTAALEGSCPEEDRESWAQLSAAARQLASQLDELELELFDGTFSIDDVAQAEERLSDSQTEESAQSATGFKAVEADFPELPSLVYDGPFSQHLVGRTPAMLEGKGEVTAEEARSIAARLLDKTDLELSGEVEGETPAYTFTCGDGKCTVQITKQGGMLLSCFTQGTPGSQQLTPKQGVQAAKTLLRNLGYEDMEESYYSLQSNILTANFCYAPNGMRCYPDLVKVAVSMEDGSLLGFEGQGYLVNHRARELEEPAVSQEEARQSVSSLLEIQTERLAVIPTRGEYEVLCWEFLGETEEGQHVISYINAATGAEEKLLLLLEDEHGTLAI